MNITKLIICLCSLLISVGCNRPIQRSREQLTDLSCIPHNAIASVNYTYRNKVYVKAGQTGVSVTEDMMIKAFINHSPGYEEFPPSYISLFEKFKCCKHINIMLLGGSFAAGVKCGQRPKTQCRWLVRFVRWLEKAFPCSTYTVIDKAEGSTTSVFGLHLVSEHRGPIDLMLVDYSMNDWDILNNGFRDSNSFYSMIESLVRKSTKIGSPAILFLSEYMPSNISEVSYLPVCDYYQIPLLSYRAATISYIEESKRTNSVSALPPLYPSDYTDVHPPWPVHQGLTDIITHYFVHLSELYVKLQPLDASSSSLPAPKFTLVDTNVPNIPGGTCENPLLIMSSMSSDHTTLPFEPYLNMQKGPEHCRDYYRGWEYTRDLPTKPMGWIAQSENRNSPIATIAFPVNLYHGDVSITYLSTYQNAGIIEIFLSMIGVVSNGGMLLPRHDEGNSSTIYCCNHSKHYEAPAVKKSQYSNSAWLDTFSNISRVSDIRTFTVNFAYRGNFLVNLRHHALDPELKAARRGDKVKILGIRSC